jgi:hypothetical protein
MREGSSLTKQQQIALSDVDVALVVVEKILNREA